MLNWSNKEMSSWQKLLFAGLVVFVLGNGWLNPQKMDPRSVSEATVEEKIRELYQIECSVELVWYVHSGFSEIIVKVSAPVEAKTNSSYQVQQYRGSTGQQWLGLCMGGAPSKSFRYTWEELVR